MYILLLLQLELLRINPEISFESKIIFRKQKKSTQKKKVTHQLKWYENYHTVIKRRVSEYKISAAPAPPAAMDKEKKMRFILCHNC